MTLTRNKTAAQTREGWSQYYSQLHSGDPSADYIFEKEFSQYVGTHTWHNTIRVIKAHAGLSPGHRVLDAGCGWGRILLGLTQDIRGLDITAMDLSEDALRIGRQRIGSKSNDNSISWVQGNLEHLTFDNDSFDSIYSARVMQHLNSPERGAHEIIRTLKPGGRFTIVLQNRLCPLNMNYYSRVYSPGEVANWFSGCAAKIEIKKSMDFIPTQTAKWLSLKSRMHFESLAESIPGLNVFGGKVVVCGTKLRS